MDTAFFGSITEHYNLWLSLYAGLGIIAVSLAGRIVRLIPAFGAAHKLNSETLAKKMERPSYAGNQAWNRRWAGLYLVVIFGMILPFCLTAEAQPWWKVLLDIFWPFIVWFTNGIFAEDRWICELEQAAFDAQGADQNQEIFPAIRNLRKVLADNGVALSS